jgi:hypothetical protein
VAGEFCPRVRLSSLPGGARRLSSGTVQAAARGRRAAKLAFRAQAARRRPGRTSGKRVDTEGNGDGGDVGRTKEEGDEGHGGEGDSDGSRSDGGCETPEEDDEDADDTEGVHSDEEDKTRG